MSDSGLMTTYPMSPFGRVAEITLGKMLQTEPASSSDVEVRYLRAGHIATSVNEADLPTMWASRDDLRRYAVRTGDLLVAEGGEVGRAEFAPSLSQPTLIQNSLHRIRSKRADIRFLRYFFIAIAGSGWLDVICNRSTFGHLTVEKLRALLVPNPPTSRQVVIADFLDAETARIDALIARKRRMHQLLDQRRAGLVETAMRNLVHEVGERPLKVLVDDITVGIVVRPSDWYAEDGVIALRGVNVAAGSLDLSDVVRITPEGHRLHAKSALRMGDVVAVRTGQAGAAAVVPAELDGANCIDLLLVRPGSLDPDFLVLVLNSDWTQKHIEQHSVGTIQSHFNVSALRDLPVPAASRAQQRELVDAADGQRRPLTAVAQHLSRQIDLLQEHRQALVTAAMTGELDVPGVAA